MVKQMKTRFCTWKFMLLVKKANRLFGMSQIKVADHCTFTKTGATIYTKEKIFIDHEQYNDEEKEAFEVNGNRIFTLTFHQVAGCYWEPK